MAANQEPLTQLIYIILLCLSYFAFASLLRGGIHHPLLLTLNFNKLAFFSLGNIFVVSLFIYVFGTLLGGKGSFQSVLLTWSYTLIPTLIWFFVTSLIYIILPPPRTLSLPGKLFSILYVAFSLSMLYWKIVLYYLSARFSLKLDLPKIAYMSTLFSLYIGFYGIFMYKIGVYRIPFI